MHLVDKIIYKELKTNKEIDRYISEATKLESDNCNYVIFDGDISTNRQIYDNFISKLNGKSIIILGNHELWESQYDNFDDIVADYRKTIEDNNLILLQNDLLIIDVFGKKTIISEDELTRLNKEQLFEKTKFASLCIFGGIGFSGKNENFNANSGIYRGKITREQEIELSNRFRVLYNKLKVITKTKVIIASHMPKPDWDDSNEYLENFWYISGHNHNNYFFDDGKTRIYANNQIGYKPKDMKVKILSFERAVDIFVYYEDGIYEITSDQYNRFLKYKNIYRETTREGKLFMIKKTGYYMFFNRTKTSLCLLYGGKATRLKNKDLNYYYDNLDYQIELLAKPARKYLDFQTQISTEIKSFGGWGKIHGAIIDIDFYNHVFVNPLDSKITPYFAYDIYYKIPYTSVGKLLEERNPEMYKKYEHLRMNWQNNKKALIICSDNKKKTRKNSYYLETTMYKISREMHKINQLNYGIIANWINVPKNRVMANITKNKIEMIK